MKKAGKIFAALLAAYMLTLFVMSCTGNCDSEEHHSAVTLESTREHHEHDTDNCSPFCSCDCCSSIITIVHLSRLNNFIPSAEKKFSLLAQSFLSAFADDCWQPPRTV